MNLQPCMLFKTMFILCIVFLTSACSDTETPKGKEKAPTTAKSEMTEGPSPMSTPESAMPEQDVPMMEQMQEQQKAPAVLENGVIYQDEIYKNWPNTEAPPAITESPVTEMMEKKVEEVKVMAEEQAATVTQAMDAQVATAAGSVTETPVTAKAPTSTAPVDGGQIYNTYCAICHKLGMNAAPKYGSKPLWAKRIAQGRDTVYNNAINGLRGMPPRGGFTQLSDEEIKAGVDYMVRASGGWGDK